MVKEHVFDSLVTLLFTENSSEKKKQNQRKKNMLNGCLQLVSLFRSKVVLFCVLTQYLSICRYVSRACRSMFEIFQNDSCRKFFIFFFDVFFFFSVEMQVDSFLQGKHTQNAKFLSTVCSL